MPSFLVRVFAKPPSGSFPEGGCVGVLILMRLGLAGGLSWPYKGLLPACVSRRTEFYFTRIICPAARKRAAAVLMQVFLH